MACTITSAYSRMRSPWKGGSSSLRWRMCSGPISVITELGPMIEAIGEAPAAEGATSGGAVKTALTASGSLTITSLRPLGKNVSVKLSPRRRTHWSITQPGASDQITVKANGDRRGPRGSASAGGSARG